jgi:hypothetical protein
MFLYGAWMEFTNHFRATGLGLAWLVMGALSFVVVVRGRLG